MNANRFEEVRIVQVNHLVSILSSGNKESAEGLGERIDEKVDSYANGESNHAMEAITLLWELLREDAGSPLTPWSDAAVGSPPPPRPPSPAIADPSDVSTPVSSFGRSRVLPTVPATGPLAKSEAS